MSHSHQYVIEVVNLHYEEVVTHSLVILRGLVTSTRRECQVDGIISAQVSDECMEGSVIDNKFKLIVELQPGVNVIILKYEDTELDFKLKLAVRDTERLVVPVYIVCCDEEGQFQAPPHVESSLASARRRIWLVTRLLQAVVAEKLWEAGVGRRTFAVSEHLGCHVHHSKLSSKAAQAMDQEQLWEYFARELVTTWGLENAANVKFLAFLACTRYKGSKGSANLTHEEIVANTKAHVALGGGGLAIFGTGCLHTWPTSLPEVVPCLTNDTTVNQALLMDDSCYRGTYGGCCSTTMGSVLHELCHTFDLGHTAKGVMGRGFDRLDLVLCAEPASTRHATVDFSVNLLVSGIQERRPAPLHRKPRAVPQGSEDLTFFTQSCAFMLTYHRWFNSNSTLNSDIKFDDASWTLRSPAGLRVVEVREGDRQVVRTSWCFSHARQVFVVPCSSLTTAAKPVLLVAEDNAGNLLRHILKL